ncbi:MAG: hypothetical protein NVS4B11_25720 [Ktedonobacteraceae bacterium]
MPDLIASVHILNPVGLVVLLILWIVLFKCTHVLLPLLRHDPLIGWAVGPLGVTFMSLHEPSLLYIWLDVLCPACISGGVLYIGLFTRLAPASLSPHPLAQILTIACGVLLTSTADVVNALRDVRHPLWGEARILRNILLFRATWTKVHFTPFGHTYLNDHFGFSPMDLLQAF